MVDVRFNHHRVHPELPAAGDLQRACQLHHAVIERGERFRAYLVGPTDESGVVGSRLEIQPAELAQNDRVGDEAFRLLVAPSIESLDHQHPQDHFGRGGMPPEPSRVGVALKKIRLEEFEEFIVIEELIKLGKLRFELHLKFGHQLEEVYGIVAVDYHRALRSCGAYLRIEILQDRPISHRQLVLEGDSANFACTILHRPFSEQT
jgi:hypothetical protein